MKQAKRQQETTTDNRIYNLSVYQCNDLCCKSCVNRRRREDYSIWTTKKRVHAKFPNWKLVSKNKKQWMKKPLKYIPYSNYRIDFHYTTIKW